MGQKPDNFRFHRNQRGFTLIEIVIVIVVLGILAAVSLPKYLDMTNSAKESAARASLGGLREAISTWRVSHIIRSGDESWPSLDSVATPGTIMLFAIPPNPYQAKDKVPDSIVQGVTRGEIVGDRGGWAYNPSTGEIWANTSTSIQTGCATSDDILENTW